MSSAFLVFLSTGTAVTAQRVQRPQRVRFVETQLEGTSEQRSALCLVWTTCAGAISASSAGPGLELAGVGVFCLFVV
jgi:hypothetical protein